MKKLISIILILFTLINQIQAFLLPEERAILTLGDNTCEYIQEKDIPTILIPGILASWYSEEGYGESNIKRWIPDPITHSYDTLIYTFKQNGYKIKDVFYKDEFTLKIDGTNPKRGLYVFGYDWKKDNKITATLLTQLIGLILKDYELHNNCNVGKVNIVAHSMGGLVARAMLEDMCVEIKEDNGIPFIEGFSKKNSVNGQIKNFISFPCNNPYSSKSISKTIKVNKLITIATPHRGSPKSFPIWEKGDIEMTDGFSIGYLGVKKQLNVNTDLGLYKLIHGFDSKIPNGIVSLGQLLPDIKNDNDYNVNKLGYVYKRKIEKRIEPKDDFFKVDDEKYNYLIDEVKKWSTFKLENYPKNSFLEELNKKSNIDSMFKKIDNKYVSFYSKITGNNGLNNILSYEVGNTTKIIMILQYPTIYVINDKSNTYIGQDIYNKYTKKFSENNYVITNLIRNQSGLGGDGTVPTNNLRLVPNDTNDGQEIANSKYKPLEIKCYDKQPIESSLITKYTVDTVINEKYGEGTLAPGSIIKSSNIKNNEAYPYVGFGAVDKYQVCQHAYMPIATSSRVIEEILDNENSFFDKRFNLLTNFGKADYTYKEKQIFGYDLWNRGIKNNAVLTELFNYSDDGNSENYSYIKSIPKYIVNSDLASNPIRFSLDLKDIDALWQYDILSPIDVLITDEQGRKIGIDRDSGMIINEIPGAWTSGRAGESGEREFFLIPVKKGEVIKHKIETNSTGTGEYHIVLSKSDINGNTESGGLVIAGTAKLGFSDDFEVVSSSSGSKFIDLNSNLELSIDVTKEFKTFNDFVDVRYNIKGEGSEKVEKIRYNLVKNSTDNNKIVAKKSNSGAQNGVELQKQIDGILNIKLDEIGTYVLTLKLLDLDNRVIKTENIEITRDERSIIKSEGKKILDSRFYKDLDLKLYETNSGILSNFDILIKTENNEQIIKIIQTDGSESSFVLDKDFVYKSNSNTLIDLIDMNNLNVVFKIKQIDKELIYTYNLKERKIKNLEILKEGKREYFYLNYNRNGTLKEIKGEKNSLEFNYDRYIGKLTTIKDLYDNKIEIYYENEEFGEVRVNNKKIDGNELLRLDIDVIFELKYKNKLQNLDGKLKSKKYDIKTILRAINSINKAKDKYLKLNKNDLIKKEIEYLVGELLTILEGLIP